MRPMSFIQYFGRDLAKQKKRASLTVAAIVWGTMSILLLLAFGEGLKQQLDRNQRGLGEDILVVWGGQTSIPYEGLPRGRPIRLRRDDVEIIRRNIPEIERIGAEYMRWSVDINYKGQIVSHRLAGEYPSYEEMRTHYPQAGGRFINESDMEQRRRVAFLGYNIKQKLFGGHEAVGETVLIAGVPFTVVGVGQNKQQMGMYSGPDVDKTSIPATTFESMFGHRFVNNLVIQPRSAALAPYVKERLYQVMGGRLKFDPADRQALSVWDTVEGRRQMQAMMLGMQIFMGIIGAMTLLIAGVGVANIMYVVVKERTREIGVKMALGAKPRVIQWQFLLEAMLICFTGGAVGIFVSQLVCDLAALVPRDASSSMSWLGNPTISLPIGLLTVAIIASLGFTAGFFPSRRASRLSPAETLRYE